MQICVFSQNLHDRDPEGGPNWRLTQYTGFVEDPKHLAWLQNILDTAALRYIAKKGEFLYMEDFAELVTQHNKDLLETSEDAPDVEGLFDDEDDQ